MANVDIDPFGEHDKTDEQLDKGETIPFTPPIVIKTPSWEPENGASFRGGKAKSTRLKESFVEKLYHVLSKETGQTPEMENCTTKARVHP